MTTTTIRVDRQTRDRLNELARRRQVPAGKLIDELVREADDRALLDAAGEAWERMAADATQLARYRAEVDDLPAFDNRLPDD